MMPVLLPSALRGTAMLLAEAALDTRMREAVFTQRSIMMNLFQVSCATLVNMHG